MNLGLAVAEFAAPWALEKVLPHTAARWVGPVDLAISLAKLGASLETLRDKLDRGAVDEMLELMRSRVPQDTGRLLNGISAEFDDGAWVVRASAVRTSSSGQESADYAAFVERGTRAGERGARVSYVADEDFFNMSTRPGTGRAYGRTRRVYRSHPGTRPQPFFFSSAEEALSHRMRNAGQAVDEATRAGGWS